MRKIGCALILLIIWILSVGAERGEEIPYDNSVDLSDYQKMYVTAYCMGNVTANGSKVHTGGCACNPHLGEVAIVYTTDGKFLGYYECNDTGSTEGLKNGTVIDIYRSNMTQCNSLMKLCKDGFVLVKWVKGNG